MEEHTVTLSTAEINLLKDALDSHRYWQLSDQNYRSNGYVLGSGSDDDENAEEIRDVNALEEKLEALGPTVTDRAK